MKEKANKKCVLNVYTAHTLRTDLIKDNTIKNILLLFTLCAYSGLCFMVFLQLD